MKKIFLLLIMFGFFVNAIAQTKASASIAINTKLTGITTAGGNYTKQTGDFMVGWSNGIFGRGFLEFDLSSIPKDATINEVSLYMSSKVNGDSNYEGKVNLYRTSVITDANYTTWQLSKGIGEAVLNIDIKAEGLTQGFTSDKLNALVKELVGTQQKMYLSINHTNEASKVMRLATSSDKLYLYVSYTTSTISNPQTGGGLSWLKPPSFIISGDEFSIGINTAQESYEVKEILYDTSDFELVQTNTGSVKLKARQISGSRMVYISVFVKRFTSLFTYDTWNYKWGFWLYGKPYIKNKDNIVCSGNTKYEIENILLPLKNMRINWEAKDNMTLVAWDSHSTIAEFKTSGNGRGKVKGTVTFDERSFELENSDVWVGKPLIPIIRGNERLEEYQSQLAYFFDGEITGASEFEWRIEGNASMLDVSKGNVITIPSETNILPMSIRTQSIGLGRWGEFNLFLKTKNICGTTPEAFVHGRIKGGKPTPEEMSDFSLSSLKTYTSDDVASANIRIYSFPTGSLVYKENKAINFDIQNTTLNAGIYILEKTDEKGNVTREKVMKIK